MSDSSPAEPRTEAGRKMLAWHLDGDDLPEHVQEAACSFLGDILAIEAEATEDAVLVAFGHRREAKASRLPAADPNRSTDEEELDDFKEWGAAAGPALADTWRDTGNRGAAEHYARLSRSDSTPEPGE